MRVKIAFEARQDEVTQGHKTTTEFERDVESTEEAYAFGYAAAQAHTALLAGLGDGYADQGDEEIEEDVEGDDG